MRQVVIHSSNGHLGYSPTEEESFRRGAERHPDFYISDSGSSDIGPKYLGMDVASSPLAWQKHDLRLMLLASRRQGVPMIIGSARDSGTNAGVDLYVSLIKEIVREEKLSPFKLAFIYSEISKELLSKKLKCGAKISGLGGFKDLALEDLKKTERIVAVMGVDPIIKALDTGVEVIITGRSSDTAIFAAAALWAGMPLAPSYFAGKALECASFCAEPYGAKETVLGTVTPEAVTLEAMAEFQSCTPESVAAHLMYERETPDEEFVPRGRLLTDKCRYEKVSPKATKVMGMRFVPSKKITVKLEGSGKVGERAAAIVGIRDSMIIKRIDDAISYARQQTARRFGKESYELYYHIYGKDGVMGALEPVEKIRSHELGIVVEAIAGERQLAKDIALAGARGLFYGRAVPGFKGTAGAATILFAEVLAGDPAYRWTLNHVMEVKDPCELFKTHTVTIN